MIPEGKTRPEDKWAVCAILGAFSVMVGGLWVLRIARPIEYWNGVMHRWSSYTASGDLGDLLSLLWFAVPLLLVVLGLALAGIGVLMLRVHLKKRRSKRKVAMIR